MPSIDRGAVVDKPADIAETKTSPGYVIGRIFGKTLPLTAIIVGLSASHLLTGDDTLMQPMMYIGGAILTLLFALVAYLGFGRAAFGDFFDGIVDDGDDGDGDGGDGGD